MTGIPKGVLWGSLRFPPPPPRSSTPREPRTRLAWWGAKPPPGGAAAAFVLDPRYNLELPFQYQTLPPPLVEQLLVEGLEEEQVGFDGRCSEYTMTPDGEVQPYLPPWYSVQQVELEDKGGSVLDLDDPQQSILRRPITRCQATVRMRGCATHHNVRQAAYEGCERQNCERPGCQKGATWKRAKRAWQVLGRLGYAPWAVLVLTLPPSLWGLASTPAGLRDLRGLAYRFASGWLTRWAWRGRSYRLGAHVVPHPTGENQEKHQPHFNVLMPLVGLDAEGKSHPGRYHLPREALQQLPFEWAAYLARHTESNLEGAVQARYEFRDALDVTKKTHAVRYFFRTFTSWKAWMQKPQAYGILARGGIPADVEPELPPPQERVRTCPHCGKDLVELASASAVCREDGWRLIGDPALIRVYLSRAPP